MKPYTCIIHVPRHVSPVSWFLTRADTAEQAAGNAVRWFLDGDGSQWTRDDIDVPLVFAGRLDPEALGEDAAPAAPATEAAGGTGEHDCRYILDGICPQCGKVFPAPAGGTGEAGR